MASEKIVIIGSGLAAWTCAIYAARANLSPVVYEGGVTNVPMGQLFQTTEVENFPGFPEGVTGPTLVLRAKEQAERFGTRVIGEDVADVDFSRRPFRLTDSAGVSVESQTIVVATGASANYLGLESETRFNNNGVSACAVCDGGLWRFRDNPLVVVGGGDSAAEEACYLSKFASRVYLVHRRDTLRASKIMVERVLSNQKVEPVWNSAVDEVLGTEEKGVTAVRVKHLPSNETRTIEATGMFTAIGHTPNTKFLRGQIETDDKGFVVLKDPFRTTTSIDGVFAAGDVADPIYKQAITAAGMGCKAALDAERWLAGKGIH